MYDAFSGYIPICGDPWPAYCRALASGYETGGVDAWRIPCRENDNDSMAPHVGCENAGGLAAFLFFLTELELRSVAVSPVGEATALAEKRIMDEVHVIGRDSGLWEQVEAQFIRFQPVRIVINMGDSPIADGLSHTQVRVHGALPGFGTDGAYDVCGTTDTNVVGGEDARRGGDPASGGGRHGSVGSGCLSERPGGGGITLVHPSEEHSNDH